MEAFEAAVSIPARLAAASIPERIAGFPVVVSPVMETEAPSDAATAIVVMALGDTATILADLDTMAAAIADTGITDAAIAVMDTEDMAIADAVTVDGVITADGDIRGTDSAQPLRSVTILTCTRIRTILRMLIARHIRTARMGTRIRLIRRNITNIPTLPRLTRRTSIHRRHPIAI